jgi:hypothetical protein
MPAKLPRIFNKRLLLRLSSLAVLVVLYYSIKWIPFQTGLRRLIAVVLSLFGQWSSGTEIGGAPSLMFADGRVYAITANCTYVDLFLLAAPFCWRFRRPLGSNLIRLAGLAAGLLILNVGLLASALFLHQRGTPWKWVHDAPHLLIHITVITLAVLSALRADDPAARLCSGPQSSPPDHSGIGPPGGRA